MRHYEIVFLVHPDQSDQTQSMLTKFSSLVSDSGGAVHRSENVGNRRLAYPIQDQFKASFALMNIECNDKVLEEIKNSFKFNDSIIRNLILVSKKAKTELSSLSAQTQEEEETGLRSDLDVSQSKQEGLVESSKSKIKEEKSVVAVKNSEQELEKETPKE